LTAKLASSYFSSQLKTEIRIGGFDLSFFRGISLEDIRILDRHGADLFSAHKLSVIPGRISLSKKILNVRRVYIDKGELQLITHKGDTSLNLQFIIDYFAPAKPSKKTGITPAPKWSIYVSSVQLVDTRFHFQDENHLPAPAGMDYTNIDVNKINLFITGFHPDGDTMNATIKSLSAIERSGFTIHSMSGDFQVGPAFLKAHNLKLITNHCNLDLSFDFLYKRWNDYTDFLNKVNIKAAINPSYFDLQDIGTFAPVLYSMKNRFKIEGDVKGTVSNFRAKDFRFALGTETMFYGNIHANGLPNVEETFVDLDIKKFTTNLGDIHAFNLPASVSNIEIPEFLKNAGTCDLKGNFTGFYNDFVATARLHTGIGDLATDLTLRKQKGVKGLFYNGEADLAGLQLGEMFNKKDLLGPVTLRADLNGWGFTLKDAIVTMNVWIDSIELNKYNYRHMSLQGRLDDKTFTGSMNVDDPNLGLDFNGFVDMSDSLPLFNFTSTLNHAQLFRLNLLKRDTLDEISSRIKANFTGNNLDNIEGTILLDNTKYREGIHTIKMDHLSLQTARDAKNNKSYHLQSDFLDADFTGNFYFSDMVPSLTTFITNYLASFELNDSLINHHPSTNQLINYSVRIKNVASLEEVFLPFLRVSPGTTLDGYYNENEGKIVLNGSAPDIAVYDMHFNNWFINATSRQDNLNIQTGCSRFFLKKENNPDSAMVKVDSLHLVSNLHHDSIFYNLSWLSFANRSTLGGFVNFRKSPELEVKLTQFHMFIDKRYWAIAGDNEVIIDSSSVMLHDLTFQSDEQKLKLDGKISSQAKDTLGVMFSSVDISDLDYLTGNSQIDIDGILSGNLKLVNITHSPRILSDLRIDKLTVSKELMGDATFKVLYDDKDKRFDVDSKIYYTGNAGTNIPLSVTGSYYLAEPKGHMNFDISLLNLNLKLVSPFVAKFMSKVSGLVSGDVKIRGTSDHPQIAGKLNLMRTEFKINYLNVAYSFADVVTIDSSSFNFNRITIYDSLGNKAYLNGKITHHNFKDLALDLNIDAEDFSAFRNTYAQNNIFYGTARATGNIRITGPTDNISIVVKAQTGGGTHVFIPISSTADISQNDYIIFSNPSKDTAIHEQVATLTTPKGLSLNLVLLVRPSADVDVSFPDQIGNIKGSGTGSLTMGMTPTTGFYLSGTYVINKGSFHFQVKNLVRMAFAIYDGSTIRWSGDPANAMINMSGVYRTRVPLGDLASNPDQQSIRIPVECVIRLTGSLMNPDISFGLNLPNVDETTRGIVYAGIDTNNVAEMNQQMFNILVFNQFKSIKGNTAGNFDVGSTSLSFFMSQVNSLISKVSKDVNIGVDYRRSTVYSGQEFDVAVSTQLFNERLLIDGLFGVNSLNPATTAQKASTIVGDIKLEYLLTLNRRWRLRAFNRTNTIIDLLDNNNAPYTQGLGLSYQRDFTNWGEFFKKDKSKGY